MIDFLYVVWAGRLYLMKSLVMRTRLLEVLSFHFKVFRLHARRKDSAGAVQSHGGNGLSYCYMTQLGPNSCMLDRVTRRFLCLYVKLLLPAIFSLSSFDAIYLAVY